MQPLPRILFAAALALAATAPLSAGWSPVGSPVQPAITLQLNPAHPELLYARVSMGEEGSEEDYLWRSEDAGASWRDVQIGLERSVTALAIDPANPRVIWAWTTDAQLWRSADAGDTWSLRYILPDFNAPEVIQLLVDPRHPRWIYRVDFGFGRDFSGTRVAVSRDAGATFSEGASVPHTSGLDSIYPRPGYDELVSFDERGLEASTDGGKTWTLRGQLDGAGFVGGRLAPSSPDVLYGLPNDRARCLARSDDGGAHWETLAHPPSLSTSDDCEDVTIDPRDAHHVWVAANAGVESRRLLFESHDGGATWSQPSTAPTTGVVAAGGDVIYTSGIRGLGLFASRNGGQAWTEIDREILAGDLRDGLVAQRPPGGGAGRRLLALSTPPDFEGGRDAAYRSDGGQSWVKLPLQETRQILDAGGSNVVALDGNGLQRSQDGGESWRSVTNAPRPFALSSDVTQPHDLTLQTFQDDGAYGRVPLWASDDGGASWHLSNRGLPDACSHFASNDVCPRFGPYAVDPFQSSRRWIFVTDDFHPGQSRVFVSENAGASWRLAVAVPGLGLALVADPRVRGRLLAGTTSGLLVSEDGGFHWRQLGDLADGVAVRQIVRDERSGTWYVATNAHGIFRGLGNGAHWTLLAGAPGHGAPTIAVDPRRPTALLAAFRGQGVWRWTP
jgi:photosystem II stability/assembly factor-like uncharacterized protein